MGCGPTLSVRHCVVSARPTGRSQRTGESAAGRWWMVSKRSLCEFILSKKGPLCETSLWVPRNRSGVLGLGSCSCSRLPLVHSWLLLAGPVTRTPGPPPRSIRAACRAPDSRKCDAAVPRHAARTSAVPSSSPCPCLPTGWGYWRLYAYVRAFPVVRPSRACAIKLHMISSSWCSDDPFAPAPWVCVVAAGGVQHGPALHSAPDPVPSNSAAAPAPVAGRVAIAAPGQCLVVSSGPAGRDPAKIASASRMRPQPHAGSAPRRKEDAGGRSRTACSSPISMPGQTGLPPKP